MRRKSVDRDAPSVVDDDGRSTALWTIGGRAYDLRPFAADHPGGAHVIELARGQCDLRHLIDSVHVFANPRRIEARLARYVVDDDNVHHDDSGTVRSATFQVAVRTRVRAMFRGKNTRATRGWALMVAFLAASWVAALGCAAHASRAHHWWTATASTLLAAHAFVCLGFTAMHDASHGAVSRNPAVNRWIVRVWNGLALWDERLWFLHHVVHHHSFTGDPRRDPDTRNLRPFLRKRPPPHAGAAAAAAAKVAARPSSWCRAASILAFLHVFPGAFIGQSVSYGRWWGRGRLWGMRAPAMAKVDVCACALRAMVLLAVLSRPWCACVYFIALNSLYAVLTLTNHDTEAVAQGGSGRDEGGDWCANQVRHSSNFATANWWVGRLYGGINFQIEHHLFPTLCHVHYPSIQAVVKQVCAEHDLPYNEYPTVCAAYASALRVLLRSNAPEEGSSRPPPPRRGKSDWPPAQRKAS